MPTSAPVVSMSAPPELPKLMAASVWMKSSKVAMPSCSRPVALTMPCVTVCESPIGSPIASTTSPARRRSERPKVTTGSGVKIDLQNGQVRVRVAADDVRIRHAAVGELHLDRVGIGDHMIVGDDVAAAVDDDAGAQAALDALPVARQEIAEQLLPDRRARCARSRGARYRY